MFKWIHIFMLLLSMLENTGIYCVYVVAFAPCVMKKITEVLRQYWGMDECHVSKVFSLFRFDGPECCLSAIFDHVVKQSFHYETIDTISR